MQSCHFVFFERRSRLKSSSPPDQKKPWTDVSLMPMAPEVEAGTASSRDHLGPPPLAVALPLALTLCLVLWRESFPLLMLLFCYPINTWYRCPSNVSLCKTPSTISWIARSKLEPRSLISVGLIQFWHINLTPGISSTPLPLGIGALSARDSLRSIVNHSIQNYYSQQVSGHRMASDK